MSMLACSKSNARDGGGGSAVSGSSQGATLEDNLRRSQTKVALPLRQPHNPLLAGPDSAISADGAASSDTRTTYTSNGQTTQGG